MTVKLQLGSASVVINIWVVPMNFILQCREIRAQYHSRGFGKWRCRMEECGNGECGNGMVGDGNVPGVGGLMAINTPSVVTYRNMGLGFKRRGLPREQSIH